MSEIKQPGHTISEQRAKPLRVAIYICVALQVLLWLGLFFYIAQHSNPKGDGMEWVAIMPASLILVIGVAPALAFRREGRLLPVGVLLACVGVVLNIALFLEIVREFAETAAR